MGHTRVPDNPVTPVWPHQVVETVGLVVFDLGRGHRVSTDLFVFCGCSIPGWDRDGDGVNTLADVHGRSFAGAHAGAFCVAQSADDRDRDLDGPIGQLSDLEFASDPGGCGW